MRQGRYNKLLQAGFTKQEARALSSIPPSSVPYLRDLIHMRKTQVRQWIKSGEVKTQKQLHQKITQFYVQKGFTKPVRYGFLKGNIQKDVWQLLRYAEKEFGCRYPSYVSPFRRKRRDFIPFRGK